jgi:Protein of unknown function with PCYCGC motif
MMFSPEPPPDPRHRQAGSISRRHALRLIGVGTAGVALAGCGGATSGPTSGSDASVEEVDYAARFAGFAPADEPDGDLSKVIWPDFVTEAGPEVRRLYEFQVVNGELMRWMPCFCGCGQDGHRNNRDCYVRAVNADGSVVFDAMAPT